MGRVGRKQILALVLKLRVMEADSLFQWALSSHGSVCKATVTSAFQSFASDCLKKKKKRKAFKVPGNIGLFI